MKRFGPFRIDPQEHALWRDAMRVPLAPKAFDVLRHLVDSAGRLVTQDDLLDAVWPRVVVNGEAVKKQILAIRKALDDDAERPRYIETVPRRGYRFIAAVTDASAPAVPERRVPGLVAREAALTTLDAHLAAAASGRRSFVFVTGEAGIGKTTLVDAFRQRCASGRGAPVAAGHCVEGFGDKEPYYPVFEALAALGRGDPASPLAQLLASHAPTWLVQFPGLVSHERRQALQAELLGATRERMVRELCEAFEAWTAAQPLVLLLEDLQWADPSTVDLLSALGRRRGPARLLVIGTLRSGDTGSATTQMRALVHDLLIHGACEQLDLHGFDPPAIVAHLQAAFPGSESGDFADVLYRHSGGNPLFLREILKELTARGVLACEAGRWRLSCPVCNVVVGVPGTLQQMVDLRFERLAPLERRTLEVVSVCGRPATVRTIAFVLALPAEDVEGACEALAGSGGFLVREAVAHEAPAGESRYAFGHVLVQQAIHARLPATARMRMHRLVGTHLKSARDAGRPEPASEVAVHLQRGGDAAGAADHLVLAADNATRRFAYRDAVRTLQEGLQLLQPLPFEGRVERELAILGSLGDIHYWLGEMTDSRDAYDRQATLAADARLPEAELQARERMLLPLGFVDPDQGVAQAELCIRRCEQLGDPSRLAYARMVAAGYRCVYDAWRNEDWDTWTSGVAARRIEDGTALPAYLHNLHCYLLALTGRHEASLALLRAWPTAGGHDMHRLMQDLFHAGAYTVALLRAGNVGQLLRYLKDGQAAAATNCTDPWLYVLREAALRTLLMDYHGARVLCEEQRSRPARHPTNQLRMIWLVAQGYEALEHGRHADALAAFAEARDPARTGKFFIHWVWRITAQTGECEALLRGGDLAAARAASEALLESALSTADPHLHALAHDMAAQVAAACGDGPAARRALDAALDRVDTFDMPIVAWRIHATACHLLGTDAASRDPQRAASHRALGIAAVERLAGCLDAAEPLRQAFLRAPAVQRLLNGA